METLVEDRVEFFQKIGQGVARQMTEALQKLTAEKIKVEFGGVQTFDEGKVLIDIGEKCFGSFVSFSCPGAELEGVVVIFFPLSSAEVMTRLLLKRYLGKVGTEKTDSTMKLSAFKEATHILLANYIAVIANALKVKLKIGMPEFVRFRNFEFLRPVFSGSHSGTDSSPCIGQFGITGPDKSAFIRGLFISAF
jgi:chemotaxis protein CheY-P-specific phosphatase CheC